MWKPTQQGQSTPELPRHPSLARPMPVQPTLKPRAPAATVGEQASISKGLSIKGEITGTESLFIDGKVEGSINIPGNRVTVGKNGQVKASISAREIVVLGKLKGNVTATDRVDIRAEGALTGDVAAARISIEDGAFFKGGIDIRKADSKPRRRRDGQSGQLLAQLQVCCAKASAQAGAFVLCARLHDRVLFFLEGSGLIGLNC